MARSKQWSAFLAVVNFFLWIPLLLFFIPGVLLMWGYKALFEWVVVKYLKPHYRGLRRMDFTMCQGDSYSLPQTNVAQVWRVAGKWITASEFSSHFHRCFLEGNPEKYRNLLAHVTTYGFYSFYSHCTLEELDLTWHIREYSVTDFGQNGTLESFAGDFMTTNTYEKKRPVWQVAVLHLGDPDQGTMETGIVAKFSHALVDGYSFVHMVSKLADNPAPYLVPEQNFTWKDKLRVIYHTPIEILAMMGGMGFDRRSRSPFQAATRECSKTKTDQQQWFMSCATMSLDTIKQIRKATNTHFACLMMSAQFGAVRRLLLETQKEAELPEYLWVGSSLPWPNHPHSLTNHWTMGYFMGPIRLADPLQRLRYVEADYRDFMEKKLDQKASISMAPLLRRLPVWVRRTILENDVSLKNVSLFFASLMQSSKQHYLLGRRVTKLYLPIAVPDVTPAALLGNTCSHSGQVDLSICASVAIVKNQEELDRLTQIYFLEELDAIAALSGLRDNKDAIPIPVPSPENKIDVVCVKDPLPRDAPVDNINCVEILQETPKVTACNSQ